MENYAVLVKSLFDLLTLLCDGLGVFFLGRTKYFDFVSKNARTTIKFTIFVNYERWEKSGGFIWLHTSTTQMPIKIMYQRIVHEKYGFEEN